MKNNIKKEDLKIGFVLVTKNGSMYKYYDSRLFLIDGYDGPAIIHLDQYDDSLINKNYEYSIKEVYEPISDEFIFSDKFEYFNKIMERAFCGEINVDNVLDTLNSIDFSIGHIKDIIMFGATKHINDEMNKLLNFVQSVENNVKLLKNIFDTDNKLLMIEEEYLNELKNKLFF